MRNVVLFAIGLVIATGVASAQDVTIDAQGRMQDEVLMDMLLDWQDYEGKSVEIKNMFYAQMGIRNYVGFHQNHSWFDTARKLHPTSFMNAQHVSLLLSPPADDRESQRWVLQMTNQYYRNPARVRMVVRPMRHTLSTGLVLNIFVIESMEINEQTIQGTVPPRLTR